MPLQAQPSRADDSDMPSDDARSVRHAGALCAQGNFAQALELLFPDKLLTRADRSTEKEIEIDSNEFRRELAEAEKQLA